MQLRFDQKNKKVFLISMLILLVLCSLLALSLGSANVSLAKIFTILNPFSDFVVSDNSRLIIEKIRLPRVLLALLIGATLSVCGVVTQGLFRNPLADPSLIGVSAGASIGATAVMSLGAGGLGLLSLSVSPLGVSLVSFGAFVCALITVFLVYALSTSQHGTSVATMLLAGIAVTALAGGFTSLLEYISNNEALRRISLWRMGGLDGANYAQVLVMLCVLCVIAVIFYRHRMALNALLLGESEARHLGLSIQRVKLSLIICVAAGVGVAVSIAGGIGFIGLVVPHIMRLLLGPDHRHLLPAALMAGAILLLLSDTLARTLIAPAELPVGIITALVGAPFFISLLRQRHRYGMQES